ncbi:MAG: O-succinylhomoserine sulfhydrylase [Rhodocyclaceae bacterium]|nr:O-succinylhomoserine sulfhydrylase [Rhodocyclaceae bacterium]
MSNNTKKQLPSGLATETLAVRAGMDRTHHREHSEAMYLTSSFVFENAAQAAVMFSGEEEGNVYARFTNPSVTLFEERLAALEGAEACIATASGMAAITAMIMANLSAGDHIIASKSLFGSTIQLLGTILPRFGIETSFVSLTDPAEWAAAIRPNTRLLFCETPSNPLTEIGDIAALAAIAMRHEVLLAVDNCFCTPVLQKPMDLGADIVVHSATKYLDGQGRVLGGAVCANKAIVEKIFVFLRTTGPTLSAFNAWVLGKGLETLAIRMRAQSAAALELAQWLEAHPAVERVYYPGLPSHPQYALAQRQQSGGGAIVSFEVKGGKDAAWRVVDSCQLLSITANLGDTRTTLTHPASTTHGRITPEARAAAGIKDNLLRMAVGLESVIDIRNDLSLGLPA